MEPPWWVVALGALVKVVTALETELKGQHGVLSHASLNLRVLTTILGLLDLLCALYGVFLACTATLSPLGFLEGVLSKETVTLHPVDLELLLRGLGLRRGEFTGLDPCFLLLLLPLALRLLVRLLVFVL